MPRADTTPGRRAKRAAQQSSSHGKLARTAASVRAAAEAAAAQQSISVPLVKHEPVPTPIPAPATHPVAPKSWRHPDELPYIRTAEKTWDDMAIVRFLAANAFSVPPRSTRTIEPWVVVRCADGADAVLPRAYRLPLLWVAKYLWTSVQLVLTADAAIRQREWDNTKFELLHIARLCAGLLAAARAQMDEGGVIERGWRCVLFDRALRRYWHDWLIMRDEFVRDVWREFGEEEFRGDVLKLGWGQWVLRGRKGFTLTKKEVAEGITAEEFTKGLVVNEDARTFAWGESPQGPSPSAAPHQEAAVTLVQPGLTSTLTPAISFLVRPDDPFHQQPPEAHQMLASTTTPPLDVTDASSSVVADMNLRGDQQHEAPRDEAVGGVARTKMGSLAPGSGCEVFQTPTAAGGTAEDGRASAGEENGEDDDKGDHAMHMDTSNDMQLDAGTVQAKQEMLEAVLPPADELDLDLEDDGLELLYPDPEPERASPSRSVESSASRAGQRRSPGSVAASDSRSPSPSPSASPVPALSRAQFPLSTAQFPPASPPAPPLSTAHFTPASPSSLVPPAAAESTVVFLSREASEDPGPVAHFLQSWGVLGEEMRALRAEVGQLRMQLAVPAALEERLRALEARRQALEVGPAASPLGAGSSVSPVVAGSGSNVAAQWVHPLQHLICADAPMDVDPPAGTMHGAPDLPPRSRKRFNAAARFPGYEG
ncbi:hypothetical protein FB451DRAFT_450417 [Mycena latifolia]|nr:hypothetical protein FB451DRAFT_450417 [Mycena latifolia]